jgi:type VI secretion system protein ImpL
MIYLKHIEGSKKGQVETFDLERVRIGRQPDNDLKFDADTDREVSGYHAEILCQGDAVSIKDLQSRNGTSVNGRRINQPTRLVDGDIIQFSSRGPKFGFSVGEPMTGSGTVALERGKAAAPEVKTKFTTRARGLMILGGAALVAILGLTFWWSRPVFFVALGITAIAVCGGLLAWWWIKRRTTRPAPPYGVPAEEHGISETPADRDALKELQDKWTEALSRLRQSKLAKAGEDPIYALPWFLIMGERGSGKTEAIRAANPPAWLSSTASRQTISGTRSCDWWFFDNLVLLDTPGRYSFPVVEQADGREWRQVLSLLKQSRAREPFNGVIVTVAADALASRSADSLQDGASTLRRRLDDMVRHFGISFPIYLLVTKVDLIPGFTEFFSSLPDAVRGQAIGVVNEDLDDHPPAMAFLGQAFESIYKRLDRLRIAVMEDEESPEILRRLFLFPEEFRSLDMPFRAFTDALFRPTRYVETPFCRGVFFTSTGQGGAAVSRISEAMGFHDSAIKPVPVSGPLFSRDLFSMILPQGRHLVRQTALWHERHRRGQRTALVTMVAVPLAFCGLVTLSFVRNSLMLSRLNLGPCSKVSGSTTLRPLGQRLKELDGCRDIISNLTPHSFSERLTTNFGLRQTSRLEGPLSRHYLQTFQREVMDPLDARIDQRLAPGPAAPLFASVVLQRINLVARCQSRDGCPDLEDRTWPNYRIMVAAENPDVQEGDPSIAQLQRTHGAFLRWQADTRALDEIRARDIQRVSRWLSSGGLRTEWILASARSQFPPVRSRDFWGWDGPPQVDPPFTQRAWQEGIEPLLTGLKAMAPESREVREALAKLEVDYRGEGLRQWGQFLASFPSGEKVPGGRGGSRDVALKALGSTSPYRRVIDAASSDLGAVLAATGQADNVPSWADSLQRYAALRTRAAEALKLAKEKPDELKAKYREEDRQAFAYLTGYFEALEQLQGELGSPEKSVRSAQKVFEEGEPTEKSGHPIHKALWNLSGLRAAIGASDKDDRIFWTLLGRPVELAWRAMLNEEGAYLQAQWEGVWLELADLAPGQRLAKVMDFVNGPAARFLERSRDRYVPKRLLNENVSFTSTFMAFLSRIRWISPDNPGRLDIPRQIVASP